MSVYDEMRNDIEVLYGGGACEYNVYSDMVDYIDEAETDYERLVDVLHEVETEAVQAYRCLQQDCATATNSSEHFFKKWWHTECELGRAKSENAKLRELVRDMWRFTGAACKKYPKLFDPSAQGGQMVQLNAIDAFEQRMRELGIKVN